jgi:hypothetical protein
MVLGLSLHIAWPRRSLSYTGRHSRSGPGRHQNAHRDFPPRSETNWGVVVLRSRGEMRGDIGPRQLLEHSSQDEIGIWNTVNGTAGISFLLSILLPCSQSCRFWPQHEFPSVPWGWNSCFLPAF